MKNSTLHLSQTEKASYHTIETSEQRIIDGIMQNSNQVIAEVYQQNFIKIKRMVWTFKNTMLDPEDIFQEGLTRAILNIQNRKFRGESSFSTYLNSICRNICLKQLSKKSNQSIEENIKYSEEDNHFELLNSLLKIKNRLDAKCRSIIDLRFTLTESKNDDPNKCCSFDEIAEKLQLSAANARQRFKRCLDKLRDLASQSPELNEYFA